MASVTGSSQVGSATVVTTSHGGLSVDHWTDRLLERILYVGEDPDCPSPIQEQALAYKAVIRDAIKHYMESAIKSDRTTLYNLLIQQGHNDMAEILRRLN